MDDPCLPTAKRTRQAEDAAPVVTAPLPNRAWWVLQQASQRDPTAPLDPRLYARAQTDAEDTE